MAARAIINICTGWRENGLPTIDVRAEYARQVALASHQYYRARCDEHADEREVIRLEVLAKLRAARISETVLVDGGRLVN